MKTHGQSKQKTAAVPNWCHWNHPVPVAAWGVLAGAGYRPQSQAACIRILTINLEELYSVLPQFSLLWNGVRVVPTSWSCEGELHLPTCTWCKGNLFDRLCSAGKSPHGLNRHHTQSSSSTTLNWGSSEWNKCKHSLSFLIVKKGKSLEKLRTWIFI